jgi:DNA-entry nuclease
MKNKFYAFIMATILFSITGCGVSDNTDNTIHAVVIGQDTINSQDTDEREVVTDIEEYVSQISTEEATTTEETENLPEVVTNPEWTDLSDIETIAVNYDGTNIVEVNDGVPDFTTEEIQEAVEALEDGTAILELSELDELGRCGTAYMMAGPETIATGERGSIAGVKPSGWVQKKYSVVGEGSSGYLYNRCHLLMWKLSSILDDERNLITGTRYFNTVLMLDYEDDLTDYIYKTNNHILYRVTPVFIGDELVARGVHMEALSVEDNGEGISFNVFVYNVQPCIYIDYSTGESWIDESTDYGPVENTDVVTEVDTASSREETNEEFVTYILNNNSKKFHTPDCESASKISDNNREESSKSREELISEGYSPCGICKP